MSLLRRGLSVGVLMLSCHVSLAQTTSTQSRPNILLILADDMGFSDIGCYGGEAKTPNLDALAADGLKFTQFYNGARCCPTRASLLTGLYAHQTGMGHMTHKDQGYPGYRADLNNQCATIAEVLSDAGYRTYMVGKWHINKNEKPAGPKYNWPLQRGFEKYYGIIWGSGSFFNPAICRGNTWYSRDNDPEYHSDNYYFTNALTDNAVTYLQQHEKESPGKPFFLYAAYTAAHWPMQALESDIAKYKGRFDAGYNKLREERVKKLRALGLMKPEWEPAPTAENWDTVKNREWELRCMEVYAAMIDSMDQGIGKIVAELKRENKLDNTLILFLQDNGACEEDVGRRPGKNDPNATFPPLRPEQVPVVRPPRQTRDGHAVGFGTGVMPGGENSWIAYGRGWANVSNTPFREYKHWTHEGGIATPLIVHWPQVIDKARRDSWVNVPGHIIDVMATCVDAAGTTYPTERKGEKIKPLQGVSLVPVFKGQQLKRAEPLFWEHESNRAVREGKWKLVAFADKPWELYDMEADRTEMHDLAQKQPDRVKELAAKWDAWAARADVLPLGGWKDPATSETQPAKTE
jgi:arylsulfatase